MGPDDVVIVGGGHAGAQAAIALRQLGFTGGIAIIGDEPDLPYERPPLSKEYLAGDKPFARMLIRPAVFWARDFVQGRALVERGARLERAQLADTRVPLKEMAPLT